MVRTVSRLCLFVLGWSVLSGCSSTEHAGSSTPSRRYTFTYEVTVPETAGEVMQVWLPLPLEDPGVQEVLRVDVQSTKGEVRRTREAKYGNPMAHVRVEDPSTPTTIRWTAEIRRWDDVGQGSGPVSGWFLRANELIPVDGTAAVLARRLRVDDSTIPVSARARTVYDDVLASMVYDKKHAGWGRGSFEHATTVCMGNCTDFHARFIGVSRAAEIPSRFTMGIPLKPGPGTYNSYHCWAHWYDGKHWRPVDISEADKIVADDPAGAALFFGNLGRDRLALSIGRDLTLSPPQAGAPLSYFVFPHAEVDGKPVALGKKDWVFGWADS